MNFKSNIRQSLAKSLLSFMSTVLVLSYYFFIRIMLPLVILGIIEIISGLRIMPHTDGQVLGVIFAIPFLFVILGTYTATFFGIIKKVDDYICKRTGIDTKETLWGGILECIAFSIFFLILLGWVFVLAPVF